MTDYDRDALELLKSSTGGAELTGAEIHSLEWLAGWETSTVANIASVIRKSREVERNRESAFTKKELMTVWGYLQSLKDIYEGKAKEAASRSDYQGARLAGDWMKLAAEIMPLQEKISREAEQCE